MSLKWFSRSKAEHSKMRPHSVTSALISGCLLCGVWLIHGWRVVKSRWSEVYDTWNRKFSVDSWGCKAYCSAFTIEEENNNQIAFLDTLVTRKDSTLIVEVYRKPTHTDRHFNFYSHHDKRHKISAAETLSYRATNLPNTKQGKETELTHVTDALRFKLPPKCHL